MRFWEYYEHAVGRWPEPFVLGEEPGTPPSDTKAVVCAEKVDAAQIEIIARLEDLEWLRLQGPGEPPDVLAPLAGLPKLRYLQVKSLARGRIAALRASASLEYLDVPDSDSFDDGDLRDIAELPLG